MFKASRFCVVLAILFIAAGSARALEDAGSSIKASVPDLNQDLEQDEATTLGDDESLADVEPIRVSMEFQDASLKDVLKVFSQQTGINVIASGDVGDQPVTLYLEEVSVMDAFDQILDAGNLSYERPLGSEIYIVRRKPKELEAAVRPITRLYRLKYARVSRSLLAMAATAFSERTPFEATLEEQNIGTAAGSQNINPEDSVGVDTVIRELLTDQGDVVVDGRTNSLIVTDIPDNFPRIEAALTALDIRTPQIMIDSEVIETTLTKLKDLGVEWGTGPEGTVFQLTPAKRTTRFPFTLFGRSTDPFLNDAGITVGNIDLSQANGVLQALETDTDTKILARPKILTLDNESAVIRLTSDEAIGFETVSQATTGTQTAEPERTTTGVVLVVTPQVNEHGYITMLVEPSVTKTVESTLTAPTGQTTPRNPKTRSARAIVRIRSGDTLVVGGLIDRSKAKSLRRVPILSGIPFVGEAFKNVEVDNSASELIVFVTPHILNEPTEAQLASVGPKTPSGLREQEKTPSREDAIERTLNVLEAGR